MSASALATRQDGPAVILVIDDDEAVREFTADTLQELGYEVLQAENGAEALRIVASAQPIDLAIVDFAMPGLNGSQTITALREQRPGLPAFYITGFAEAPGLVLGPGDGLLRKPFRVADLARKVSHTLAHPSGGDIGASCDRPD